MANSVEYTEGLKQLISDNATEKLQSHYKYWRGQADLISDEILNKAIYDGYNIAWETTGNTIAWTVKVIKQVMSKGYRVVVVYPLVPTSLLIERGIKRLKTTMQVMAPANQISKMAINAAKNIKQLLPHVDNIYIYDNTGSTATIIIEVENRYPGISESEATGGVITVSKCNYKHLKSNAQRFATEISEILQQLCSLQNRH
jgi:predicted ABC-type ATPase